LRQVQALLARSGFDPHRVPGMNAHEVASHLANIRALNGQPTAGSTRRFKGARKTKK